ncbi:MAG: hypothetical protein LBG27_08080 [Spirochaetaceae bacterium]|jgi:hypothetical protein|nr:hypothetical protein [Spirochaetaceae bacterium]
MNKPRKLQQNVWYKVETEINIGEPLFKLPWTKVLLYRVLREIKKRYPFEMRGLRLEGARLTFYIKPKDGFMLPLIMQLLKQTFSLRFNIIAGRTGHVWGGAVRVGDLGRGAARVGGRGGLGGDRQVGKHANTGGGGLHLELGQP